ncbi:hypothetical protein M426DRAFT_24772 [Hypoxylon sp. CI-4A]|nr:hypothetical protein M426DRAFT_24772 [Hypoxylon sp. CI-4A]
MPQTSDAKKHGSLYQYAPFEPFDHPELLPKSHPARDLMNFTVAAFHREDENLSDRQIAARKSFATRVKDREESYGDKLETLTPLKHCKDDLQHLFDQLDEFFFFNRLGAHVSLKGGLDVVGKDPLEIDKRLEGETYSVKARGREYTQININLGTDAKLYEMSAIIGQLMHEMVHAYYGVFACDCEDCSSNQTIKLGVKDDWHGPLFLQLHRLILTELRRWGKKFNLPGLASLLADDCPEDKISQGAKERADAAIKKGRVLENPQLKNLHTLTSPRVLVAFTVDRRRVRVHPSLVAKQLAKEEVLRQRLKRVAQLEEEAAAKETARSAQAETETETEVDL